MDIFLGWSGEESREIAAILRTWLKYVCNSFEPWISDEISKGARWNTEIAARLRKSGAGIFVLTPGALESPWLHFESGAISNVPGAHVCTLLHRVTATGVKRPLADFQHTILGDKEDMRKLIKSLWRQLPQDESRLSEKELDESFDHWWPKMQSDLRGAPTTGDEERQRPEPSEMIEETLLLVRELASKVRDTKKLVGIASDEPEEALSYLKRAIQMGGTARGVRAAAEALLEGASAESVLSVLNRSFSSEEAQNVLEMAKARIASSVGQNHFQ